MSPAHFWFGRLHKIALQQIRSDVERLVADGHRSELTRSSNDDPIFAHQANRDNVRSDPGADIDVVSIRDRPAEVKDRAIPGHWEGDLLSGCRNMHIATLVERSSRFVMLVKVGARTATVSSAP